MRLKDKVAIVTGAGSGIGRGIAHCMAQEGASVVIADIKENDASKVAEEIVSRGNTAATYLYVDVADESGVKRMVEDTVKIFGKIDILVNNAGVSGYPAKPFEWQEEEDWDKTFDVNVKAILRTVKAVTPYFLEQKSGRIINISSIAGFMPGSMKPAYSVSKVSVAALTMIMAKDFAPYGITVNAIAPGLLWTGLWEKLAEQLKESRQESAEMSPREIFEKRMRELTPMGREQTPEDIGWAAVYFASDEAKNVTGQLLFVDGGCIMRP